jgi:hypothetical protein
VDGSHYEKKNRSYDPDVNVDINGFNRGIIGVENRISIPNDNDM